MMGKSEDVSRITVEFWNPWPPSLAYAEPHELRQLPAEERPPGAWRMIPDRLRGPLAGLVRKVLEHFSDGPFRVEQLAYLQQRLYEALQSTCNLTRAEQRGGYGHDLRGWYDPDEARRRLWREVCSLILGAAEGFDSINLLNELFKKISAQGSALETLKARRAALDAEIARLEALSAGPSTPEAA
jgi:hypothetical protein